MKRRLGGAEVDMMFPPDLVYESQGTFAVDKGFEIRKPFPGPIEFPPVDHHAADGRTMAV